MNSDTSPYPAPPPPPPPRAAQPAAVGWTGSDLAIGGALVVLLIALFLPWFSSKVFPGPGTPAISGVGDGPASHGYLWTVFVLAVVALAVLVARDAIARLPGNLPSPQQLLVGATGLALLLTILGVAQKPSPVAASSGPVISQVFEHFTVSVGWSYGGFVALLAALIAVIAAVTAAGLPHSGRRMTLPSLRRHPGVG
jgi:uncharacterized membrane protein